MRIRKPGKVCERIWFLGREESGVYLLEGDNSSMIVSGGLSYLLLEILEQFKKFAIDENRIQKILILHSHFDHVGIIPFLKRRHPKIEIYASQRAWEILQMDKAILTINEFSRNAARRMKKEDIYFHFDLEWKKDISGKTVQEGNRIDLGGLEVSILEIPGHSSCCIAAYIPELQVLFPTDGGGIPFNQTIISSGNSNFTKYQENLERMKKLEVQYYCADHYGYITGEEAQEFILKSIEMAKIFRSQMEEVYRSTRDVEKTVQKLVSSFYEEKPSYFLDPRLLLDIYRQMVRHIASMMEEKV